MVQIINKISLALPFLPLCHPWADSSCFAKQNLELLDPRIHIKAIRDHLFINGSSGQEQPLFFFEKQAFSSPRMTQGVEVK